MQRNSRESRTCCRGNVKMSQTLCKNTKGKRSLAYELMVNTPAIGNLIREKKVSQIYSQLQTGSQEGMNTLEQCLRELIDKNKISLEEARTIGF